MWSDQLAGDRLTGVQWAGPDRIIVIQPEIANAQGQLLPAQAYFVSLPDGATSTAPSGVADSGLCCLSISPDATLPNGTHAILRVNVQLDPQDGNDYAGIAPGGSRCTLRKIERETEIVGMLSNEADYATPFCGFVDWTRDGQLALVSQGGH